MSLINDALQRAKAAQQQTPPPAAEHLPLRPVDPQVVITHGVGLVLPIAFATVALLLLFFVWRFYMNRGAQERSELTVAARTNAAQTAPPAADVPVVPVAPPVATRVQAAPPVAASAPAEKTAPAPGTNPAMEPAPANTNAVATTPAPAVTNGPPPLKLQGVAYSRTRPSAIISGKTVFLGDRVRDFRVVAISAESVTLTASGRTNVLVLSD